MRQVQTEFQDKCFGKAEAFLMVQYQGDTISVALDKKHLWDEVACYDIKTTKGYTYIGKNLCDVFMYKKEFPLGYDIVNFTRCMYQTSTMSLFRVSTTGLASKEYRCSKIKKY